jgi:hypothetical protein
MHLLACILNVSLHALCNLHLKCTRHGGDDSDECRRVGRSQRECLLFKWHRVDLEVGVGVLQHCNEEKEELHLANRQLIVVRAYR